MQLKQKIKNTLNKIILLPIWVKALVSLFLLIFIIFFALFLQVKPVVFSYASKTCVQQITILPGVGKIAGSDHGFEIKTDNVLKIGNFEIISLKTCFKAKKAPSSGDSVISFAPFGGWLGRKTYKISVPAPPLVKVGVLSNPIPTVKPLKLSLSNNDSIFEYNLLIDKKTADCPMKDSAIHCEVVNLDLLQNTDYHIELVRMFNQKKVETIISKDIKTLSATNVISSSVSQDQTIYDNSKAFIFEFDKNIIGAIVEISKIDGDKRILVPSITKIEKNKATMTVEKDLDRDSRYEFTISKLEAEDGSTLPAPYNLSFKMSDGPGVANVNVGNYGLSTTQTIILTFDQALASNTDITKYVSTSGIPTSISRSNNQVYIRYTNASMCTDLSISVKSGLVSSIGVIQSDGWSFSTRTVCHTTSTIGYSKDGRPITAYIFGSGGTTILYTGGLHGNELSGKYLMDAWVNELEINARSIPADRKIVVIPNLNPDGVAAVRRNNSNNVDLNRNFPTGDWQADVYSPSNQLIPGGGGVSSLSEPESQAIALYTIQLSPRLTMSFHSSASYVIANDAGDSNALAASYAQLTGYRNMTGVNGAFSYPITGTYDTWLYEKYGLTSLIIELSSSTNAEFTRNKPALWAMARS